MVWKVAALAEDSDQVYVYRVTAPPTAKPEDVVNSAYAAHGKLLRDGMVDDYLGPMHSEPQWEEDDGSSPL